MELEPITRQEKIIAGQDLTPITRLEIFLKNFGGGGGSVPKPLTYDYMPEGYPKKTVQTTVLMEEQEVAFVENNGAYAAHLTYGNSLVEGQTYIVNWDGAEYRCIAKSVMGFVAIGNLSISGFGEDSGEPFLHDSSQKSIGTLDTSPSHTISIKTVMEVITPMAEEFMPVLTSPNGTKYKLTVDDTGTLSATEVT